MTSRRVVPGLYDLVVSEALGALIEGLPAEVRAFEEQLGNDREVAASALARLVHDPLRVTLRSLADTKGATSVERQIALTNAILGCMEGISKTGATDGQRR